MPSGVYPHPMFIKFTPEEDEAIVSMWDSYTYDEIIDALCKLGKERVSRTTISRRGKQLGMPTKRTALNKPTDEMKDFCFVNRELSVRELTKRFNEYFHRDWSRPKILRILLDSKGEKMYQMTVAEFAEEWLKLQAKFTAEPQQVAAPHWLWRWKRFDRTTTSGAVFRGKAEPMPTIFSEAQFAAEWRKMQRSFGIE